MNNFIYYLTVFLNTVTLYLVIIKKRTNKHIYCPECGKNKEDY